jgi:MFS family permease
MLLFYSGHAGMDLLWGEVGANAQAFTIAIAAEGVATLVLSNFIERQGPYRCVLYSTMFAAPAWAFACLGTWKQEKLIVYILFGYSLGHCWRVWVCRYVGSFLHTFFVTDRSLDQTCLAGCVANMQRWFPDYKGLAAGFTVMGFGFGAFMWQLVGNALMDPAGHLHLAAYQVHGIFAAIFICAMVLCLPFIRAPPPGFQPPPSVDPSQRGLGMRVLNVLFPTSKPTPADKTYTYLEAIFQLEFVLICLAMFGTFLPGVVFISSAADMTKYVFKKDPQYANLIVSAISSSACILSKTIARHLCPLCRLPC